MTTMSVADLPIWVVILVSGLLLIGSALTLLGAIGLLRLPTFYERIHAPTLGTSWGVGAIMLASIIYSRSSAPAPSCTRSSSASSSL